MQYLAGIVLVIYYLRFILYFGKMFPVSRRNPFSVALLIGLIIGLYALAGYFHIRAFSILVIAIPMTLGLYGLTGMNFLQATYGGCISVLAGYGFRGMVSGICTFIVPSNYARFLYDDTFYHLMTTAALPLTILFFEVLRKTVAQDKRLKRLLENKPQLKLIVVYEIAMIVFLVMINHGRFLDPNEQWYTGLMLVSCLLSIGMLAFMVSYSIRLCEYFDTTYHTQQLSQQYERQLRHYESYQKFTESFRAFKHDYKALMGSLKPMVMAGENEKALRLLDEIHDEMQRKVLIHKVYSNNVTLDALLQDTANICHEEGIHFTAAAHVPTSADLSSMDAIRIFSNLTTNAIEACRKIDRAERFLRIASSSHAGWGTLEVANSYNGIVTRVKGRIETTKTDKDFHGIGLQTVIDIAQNIGGFVTIDPDAKTRVFTVRVHMPVEDAQAQGI